jgi:tryptophan halogenase
MNTTDAVPADAFKLALDGQGIAIDFGKLEGTPLPSDPVTISVSDRVVMPVLTARRLLIWLDDALKPHAGTLRAEQAKALAPADAALAARPGQSSQRPLADISGEKAAQLLRMVGEWGVPHQYERSLRLSAGSLQANRFLLTLNTRDIPGDPSARTLAVCDYFAMPPTLRQAAEANFAMAKCVHFGFEGDPQSIICKLYLESAVSAQEAHRARTANQPVLLHLAFKWDLLRDAAVTTRYLWHPGLSASEIATRLAQVYRDQQPASLALARGLLDLAVQKVAAESLQYLEVEEPETARRSFDLNIYTTKLFVRDVQPLLARMREHFGIRPGQFQALYDQIKPMALGHLAGGVHRNGKDFFNLYYGAVGLPHFNSGLR